MKIIIYLRLEVIDAEDIDVEEVIAMEMVVEVIEVEELGTLLILQF